MVFVALPHQYSIALLIATLASLLESLECVRRTPCLPAVGADEEAERLAPLELVEGNPRARLIDWRRWDPTIHHGKSRDAMMGSACVLVQRPFRPKFTVALLAVVCHWVGSACVLVQRPFRPKFTVALLAFVCHRVDGTRVLLQRLRGAKSTVAAPAFVERRTQTSHL
jgi:hypothetical protein